MERCGFAGMTPTWVEGIGPPLEQIEEDCRAALELPGTERQAVRDTLALIAEVKRLREALDRIGKQQPRTLETLRKLGIVFDGPLGADPANWQHVAFSIYTDLCEVDLWARAALDVRP